MTIWQFANWNRKFKAKQGGDTPNGSPRASNSGRSLEKLLHRSSTKTVGLNKSLLLNANKRRTAQWLVPSEHPIELLFFRRIFSKLRKKIASSEEEDGTPQNEELGVNEELPLSIFQRAMGRLLLALQEDAHGNEHRFDANVYDRNGNGMVGWWEFCSVWKDQQIKLKLSVAERIFLTFDDPQASKLGRFVSFLVIATIMVSSSSFMMATSPNFQEELPKVNYEPQPIGSFETVEKVCIAFFTFEYLARLLTCWAVRGDVADRESLLEHICGEEQMSRPHAVVRLWKFLVAPANLIDLVAILPFYVAMFVSTGSNSLLVLRLVRLTRIFRAFRLGKYVEAVIIIARAMSKSLRALYVLAFNMMVGVVIFGSLIFAAEQGTWNKETRTFDRPLNTWSWTPDANCVDGQCSGTWTEDTEESPFRSIPAAFWWALVTSTTVGYGDHYPTTPGGKFVAAVCMVWSLVVLALPIGIIGNTFGVVWQEYEDEKKLAEEHNEREAAHVRDAMMYWEPIAWCRQVLLEVWDEDDLPGKAAGDFMGEAVFDLNLQAQSATHDVLVIPLAANRKKAKRRVSGSVTIEYYWEPEQMPFKSAGDDDDEDDPVLKGCLDFKVISAEGLVNLDWKVTGQGVSDPYVKIVLHPRSPGTDGIVKPEVWCTGVKSNNLNPIWNENHKFNFCWYSKSVANVTNDVLTKRTLTTITNDVLTRQSTVSTMKNGEAAASGNSLSVKEAAMPRNSSATDDDLRQILESISVLAGSVVGVQQQLGQLSTRLAQVEGGGSIDSVHAGASVLHTSSNEKVQPDTALNKDANEDFDPDSTPRSSVRLPPIQDGASKRKSSRPDNSDHFSSLVYNDSRSNETDLPNCVQSTTETVIV